MVRREAKVTPEIQKYIEMKKIYGLIEVKQTTTDRFNLSKFEEGQLPGLLASEEGGLVVKWSDQDTREKVADIISLPPGHASHVIIKYPKAWYVIKTIDIVLSKENGLKSLTSEEANGLCVFRVLR